MRIVIAGGGKVGYYLVKTLLPFDHKITVIDPAKDTCIRVSNDLSVLTVHGDATNLNIMQEAEIEHADIFIAVTGNDETNLISCQLAKGYFNVSKTISRVNNPKNITVFERLGVDNAISSTSIIAELIEQEIDFSGIKTLMKLKSGKVSLTEIILPPTSPVRDKALKDIKIPRDCVLISILRDDEVIIPNGFTVLKSGDFIFAVHTEEDHQELKEFFIG